MVRLITMVRIKITTKSVGGTIFHTFEDVEVYGFLNRVVEGKVVKDYMIASGRGYVVQQGRVDGEDLIEVKIPITSPVYFRNVEGFDKFEVYVQ